MHGKIWFSSARDYISSEKHGDLSCLRSGRVNFLVGANNAGKSRFMRGLFASPSDEVLVSTESWAAEFKMELADVLEKIPAHFSGDYVKGKELHRLVNGCFEPIGVLKKLVAEVIKFIEYAYKYENIPGYVEDNNYIRKIKWAMAAADRTRKKGFSLDAVKKINHSFEIPDRFYIPILRGMRPFEGGKDLLRDRTIKDYFNLCDINENNIITGFGLYETLKRKLLGKPIDRKTVRAYEDIISQEFFGGQEVSLIPEYDSDTVAVKIGDDEQFPIYHLGDGLQQLIIISSSAYLNTKESMYFIEEPETSLHPGLLRKLIEFLINHTEHQYFITTHSNHLLELGELYDCVVVQRFSKTKSGNDAIFSIKECSKDRELLAELGVHASSVYLANSTIWVEGITDRLYLGAFMNRYVACLSNEEEKALLASFIENHHYTFIEYQGGNIGHWRFDEKVSKCLQAITLCSEAFVIADGDIRGKGARAADLESQLGDRFFVLPGKEIENMLPAEVLRNAAVNIFENKKRRNEFNVSKLDGISYEDYFKSNQGIGRYLDGLLFKDGKADGLKGLFSDESGTIADKVKFCRMAVKYMRETEWGLTEEIMTLCAAIFAHIKKNNPMARVFR